MIAGRPPVIKKAKYALFEYAAHWSRTQDLWVPRPVPILLSYFYC